MLLNNQMHKVFSPEDLAKFKNLKEQLYLGLLQSVDIGKHNENFTIWTITHISISVFVDHLPYKSLCACYYRNNNA